MPQLDYLQEMNVGARWCLRRPVGYITPNSPAAATTNASTPVRTEISKSPALPSPILPVADASQGVSLTTVSKSSWQELQQLVVECNNCTLSEKRQQAVVGMGEHNADLLLVGEAPGAEEDQQGQPFVGPSGKLLDAMLASINLNRSKNIYITNAVKCRPQYNRTPSSEEMQTCLPYLQHQIELLQPSLIVTLGRPAMITLLQKEISLLSARGVLHEYQGRPLIVTYHPSYLLRRPIEKRLVWQDLCFIRSTMLQLGIATT